VRVSIAVARQRLGKHIFVQANLLDNKTSIARQRISKHPPLTIEFVFSVGSVQIFRKEVVGRTEQ
jgi:hypothetical protein